MNFIDCINLLVLLTTQIPILSTLPITSSLDIPVTNTAITSTAADSTEESCQRQTKKLEDGVGVVTYNVYGSGSHCSNGKPVIFADDNAPAEYIMLKPYQASQT